MLRSLLMRDRYSDEPSSLPLATMPGGQGETVLEDSFFLMLPTRNEVWIFPFFFPSLFLGLVALRVELGEHSAVSCTTGGSYFVKVRNWVIWKQIDRLIESIVYFDARKWSRDHSTTHTFIMWRKYAKIAIFIGTNLDANAERMYFIPALRLNDLLFCFYNCRFYL